MCVSAQLFVRLSLSLSLIRSLRVCVCCSCEHRFVVATISVPNEPLLGLNVPQGSLNLKSFKALLIQGL